MSIEALKEQARSHEQNENWAKALEAYQEAIGRQGAEDQPDLGLYNRAGDLSTRLGDKLGAIGHYERAVELYLESELPNNAIAILKKILRNMPDRAEVYLRIGQIRAAQGFLTDARDNFLIYAEHMQQAGNMEEAFRALSEFAELAPDDVDTRLALAEQFRAHDRSQDALEQLMRARQTVASRGNAEAADAIAERILEIDPDATIVDPVSAAPAAGTEASPARDRASEDWAVQAGASVEDGIEFHGDVGVIALDEDEAIPLDLSEHAEGLGDPATLENVVQLDDFEPTAAAPVLDAGDETDGEDFEPAIEASFDIEAAALDVPGAVDLDESAAVDLDESTAVDLDPSGAVDLDDGGFAWEESNVDTLVLDGVDDGLDASGDGEVGLGEPPASDAIGADEAGWDDEVEIELEAGADDPTVDPSAPDVGYVEAEADAYELDDDAVADLEIEDAEIETFELDESELESAPAAALEAELVAEADDDEGTVQGSLEAALIDFDKLDQAAAAAAAQEEAKAELEATAEPEDQAARDDWDEADASAWEAEPEEARVEQEADGGAPLAEEGTVAVEAADEWIGLDDAIQGEEDDAAAPLGSDDERTSWAHEFELESVEFDSMDESQLREYVSSTPDAGAAWEQLGRLVVARGDQEAAAAAFERAHEAFAADRDFHSAMRNVRELLLIDPDSVAYHQRLVEYAHRGDDRTLLVSAFLELGDCLRRTGEPEKSDAVYEKVLEIDPGNRRARVALGAVEPEDAGDRSDDAYVDLGSMILEKREKTTRWTVETEDPTGDEEFDFQDMLRQFRAKVAEHVDVDDVQAHYDLGTAYKEMGLLDEAISEFQQALRADARNLATYEVLGQTFMEKGQPEVAIRTLSRATDMPFDVEDELLGIYYYLGRAHEELGNRDDAVEYYEKVFALDINFEDVTERLRSLR